MKYKRNVILTPLKLPVHHHSIEDPTKIYTTVAYSDSIIMSEWIRICAAVNVWVRTRLSLFIYQSHIEILKKKTSVRIVITRLRKIIIHNRFQNNIISFTEIHIHLYIWFNWWKCLTNFNTGTDNTHLAIVSTIVTWVEAMVY